MVVVGGVLVLLVVVLAVSLSVGREADPTAVAARSAGGLTQAEKDESRMGGPHVPFQSELPDQRNAKGKAAATGLLPEYYVFSNKNAENRYGGARVWVKLVATDSISEESIRSLLVHTYDEVRQAKLFTDHAAATHITIMIYDSVEQAKCGLYTLGSAWMGPANEEPMYHVDTEAIKRLDEPPVTRFGLSEAQRKLIFQQLVRYHDKAYDVAEARFPTAGMSVEDTDRQIDLIEELIAEYKEEAKRNLNLTEEQYKSIWREGYMRDWPILD